MLSTLFPPDPTLTVDNVSRIIEKVEPKERQPLLQEMLVLSSIFDKIQSSGKYPTASEVEAAAVDIYINCDPWATWEDFARSLYRHHQVAAVEEVRSYLPPRGEPAWLWDIIMSIGLMCFYDDLVESHFKPYNYCIHRPHYNY